MLCRSVRQAMEVASFRVRLQTLLHGRRLRSRSDYLTLARPFFPERFWDKSTKRHRRDLLVEGIRLRAGSLRSPGGVRIAPQDRHVGLSRELLWRSADWPGTWQLRGDAKGTSFVPGLPWGYADVAVRGMAQPVVRPGEEAIPCLRPTMLVTCLENPG